MPTKTFPTIMAIRWLKTRKLCPADMLELKLHREDLERFTLRLAEYDAAIAELSVEDDDVRLFIC